MAILHVLPQPERARREPIASTACLGAASDWARLTDFASDSLVKKPLSIVEQVERAERQKEA